jgi:hypothetical protein
MGRSWRELRSQVLSRSARADAQGAYEIDVEIQAWCRHKGCVALWRAHGPTRFWRMEIAGVHAVVALKTALRNPSSFERTRNVSFKAKAVMKAAFQSLAAGARDQVHFLAAEKT